MSRFFMQDTSHAAFERMMMDVSRKPDNTERSKKPKDRERKNPPTQKAGEEK